MIARQLYFTNPHEVEVRKHELPPLQADQVLVENLYSAVSAGTEMLLYRGQLPEAMALDANLSTFADQRAQYPTPYGYAVVGRIEAVGENVDAAFIGTTVFSFEPHASHHICKLDSVIAVPDGIDPREAVFLANMETAVNLVQDGYPRLGERAVLLGQGVVGLLVAAIMAEFPLSGLFAVDAHENRRALSAETGVNATFSLDSEEELAALRERLSLSESSGGADLVFELSGSPAALDLAVELCAYTGRIVVGSWYGTKREPLNLGEKFHRNRISIVSSQVSSIAPEMSGRWDKARRFDVAWDMIKKCQPAQFISHSMSLDAASEAYRLLDESPEETVQVIFDYQN